MTPVPPGAPQGAAAPGDAPLPALPSGVLADAAEALGWVIEDIADDLATQPTLEELLAVLGWGVPEDDDGFADGPYEQPFPFTARQVGDRAYRPGRPAQTDELGDAAFAQSAELLAPVLSAAASVAGGSLVRSQLADAVAQLLHVLARGGAGPALDDVTWDELRSVTLRPAPAATS